MTGVQTRDFDDNTCEVLKLYKKDIIQPSPYEAFASQPRSPLSEVATIFRKPNGEFDVHGACLVRNEQKEVPRERYGERRRYYRNLRIVTPSSNVVEFERHGTRDYRMITSGYELGAVNWVQV